MSGAREMSLKQWINFLGMHVRIGECTCDAASDACACATLLLKPASKYIAPVLSPSVCSLEPARLRIAWETMLGSNRGTVEIDAHSTTERRAILGDSLCDSIVSGETRCLLVRPDESRAILEAVHAIEPGIVAARLFIPARSTQMSDGALRIFSLTEIC